MAVLVRTALTLCFCFMAALLSLAAPTDDHGSDGMVVEDITEILRGGEGRYAQCPPQKILIGSRCRQILSEEELRKVSMLEDYSDCVRKNVEDFYASGGQNETQPAPGLVHIHSYCMTMCMLRAEGL
ncbi:uncharacterized protein [Hetaerina americana]|uniref:uncharacterized protein n=1 Tax=Hetaerina americana TaxID=62018 RepID=UPI003A7F5BA7